jgi:hypothetical protein
LKKQKQIFATQQTSRKVGMQANIVKFSPYR